MVVIFGTYKCVGHSIPLLKNLLKYEKLTYMYCACYSFTLYAGVRVVMKTVAARLIYM